MKDATLGGYLQEHERPPAFEARDGASYTVEVLTERAGPGEEGGWRAYLFFVKWSGVEPSGHVETEYLAEAATEDEARTELEKLDLHEVKELLDKLVTR
jgi:hypothetical protein